MEVKTYAARGLLDFQMALRVDGAVIRLTFNSGMMGGNGVIPAKYTTGNPALQKMIEKSPQFNSGRVYIHNRVTLKDEEQQKEESKDKTKNGKAKN